VFAVLGVIKPCTRSYTRTLRFLIPRSCAYLDSLDKFGLQAKSGCKNKCLARAGFGLQNEAHFSYGKDELKVKIANAVNISEKALIVYFSIPDKMYGRCCSEAKFS